MNAIWIEVWGALTPASKSKGRAPNHMQLVQYVKVFRSYMGKHRDNRMMEVYGDDIRVDDAYPDRVRDILS